MHDSVIVLDFGSQYTQLIARTVRNLHVYSEILPCTATFDDIRAKNPKAIILSGSPYSIYNTTAPLPPNDIWEMNVPILGICYGMQIIAQHFGGKVKRAEKKEYGSAILTIKDKKNKLFIGLANQETVWMSHGDEISSLPECFQCLAFSTNTQFAAIVHKVKPIYALQFHPEVVHSPCGKQIISNFLFEIAHIKADWTPQSFIKETILNIRDTVNEKKVILGLSGGVDSSVAALLIHRAIGKQLIPIFVDTGLLRKNEAKKIKLMFSTISGFSFITVKAGKVFLDRLKNIIDPEKKRKIIGQTFIEIFEHMAKKYPDAEFLAQGTLYPDVIESVSFKGPSVTIKSHHNVGGLPEKMNLKLVEPLRELFKDEVREVGRELGLPEKILMRHPFPGPGLAVRILGKITPQRVRTLQKIDDIFISELEEKKLYDSTWQAFAVLLPVQSVGVMGDERTYANVCALRAVNSVDGMTADWTELPYDFLKRVSNRIINEVRGVNRVVYDISSKPPATIEWE